MEDSELDRLIICKKCHTLHRKIKLHNGTKALCQQCNSLIYRHHDRGFIDRLLALSWVALITLIVAFTFSIMSISINGVYQNLDIISIFETVFDREYYLMGGMLLFLIFIFPLSILLSMIVALTLMRLKRGSRLVKALLIFVAKIVPWSMVDIFFVSILVAMVKLFNYAQLEFGIAFVALFTVILLDIFILKRVTMGDIWEEYEMVYGEEDGKH
jgi:paraquat-inducible protein A